MSVEFWVRIFETKIQIPWVHGESSISPFLGKYDQSSSELTFEIFYLGDVCVCVCVCCVCVCACVCVRARARARGGWGGGL